MKAPWVRRRCATPRRAPGPMRAPCFFWRGGTRGMLREVGFLPAKCEVFMGLGWDLDGIEISISCAKSVEITPSYYDLLICDDDVSKVHGATNL